METTLFKGCLLLIKEGTQPGTHTVMSSLFYLFLGSAPFVSSWDKAVVSHEMGHLVTNGEGNRGGNRSTRHTIFVRGSYKSRTAIYK